MGEPHNRIHVSPGEDIVFVVLADGRGHWPPAGRVTFSPPLQKHATTKCATENAETVWDLRLRRRENDDGDRVPCAASPSPSRPRGRARVGSAGAGGGWFINSPSWPSLITRVRSLGDTLDVRPTCHSSLMFSFLRSADALMSWCSRISQPMLLLWKKI